MSGLMPASTVPNGILEIFLYGGLNPFDTFYVVPEYGDPRKADTNTKIRWWVYQDETVYPEHRAARVQNGRGEIASFWCLGGPMR